MNESYINGIDNDFPVEIDDVEYEMEEVRFHSEMNKLRALIKESELELCKKKKAFAQNCRHLEIDYTPIYEEDEYGSVLWSSARYRYSCKRCSSVIELYERYAYKEVVATLKSKLEDVNI